MHDTSSRKDVRKAEKALAIAARAHVEFLHNSLATEAGRSWFHNLLAGCHLFADPFTGNALLEAYNKGERNVGLRVFSDIISHCPDQYILMMREASIRSEINGRRSDDDNRDSSSEYDGSADSGRDDQGSGIVYTDDDGYEHRYHTDR